jgi:hypothetical protein
MQKSCCDCHLDPDEVKPEVMGSSEVMPGPEVLTASKESSQAGDQQLLTGSYKYCWEIICSKKLILPFSEDDTVDRIFIEK